MHASHRALPFLCFAAFLPFAAQAITLQSVQANGNTVDTAFSTAALVALDVGFVGFSPVIATFSLDRDDVDAAVDFNAIVRQISGGTLPGVLLGLSTGASFESLGSVVELGGGLARPFSTPGGARVDFAPSVSEAYFGNPLLSPDSTDFRIAFNGLSAGDSFTVTVSVVPEPASWALFLMGAAALLARRLRG